MALRLRRVDLREVGPFEHLDLVLPEGRDPSRADIHLLVGPNGCGKSTVLSAIAQCFAPIEDVGFVRRARSPSSCVALDLTAGWVGRWRGPGGIDKTIESAAGGFVSGPSRVFGHQLHGQALDPVLAYVRGTAESTPYACFH